MYTGPVEPVKVFFHWPEAVSGKFLLIWGQQFNVSVEPSKRPSNPTPDLLNLSSTTVNQKSFTIQGP